MINKEMLLKMTKKEIEKIFNSFLKDFNETSIDPSSIKTLL